MCIITPKFRYLIENFFSDIKKNIRIMVRKEKHIMVRKRKTYY
jgi:hypothetical protein